MQSCIEHEYALNPVTALAFASHTLTGQLLLAGEGPFLRIYESSVGPVSAPIRVFKEQTVHGIAVQESISRSGNALHQDVLIWGGQSIRVVGIEWSTAPVQDGAADFKLSLQTPETEASDWILHGAIAPSHNPIATCPTMEAALVTAHNALIKLQMICDTAHVDPHRIKLEDVTASSRSILYSAHVIWLDDQRVLVAGGTVFGDAVVWSCTLNGSESSASSKVPNKQLHHIFKGHDGSIFGIHISPELDAGPHRTPYRLLATCSDDRTIRLWELADLRGGIVSKSPDSSFPLSEMYETGFASNLSKEPQMTHQKHCISQIWAHISRIWGVQFIGSHQKGPQEVVGLLSHGEDATCQQWQWSKHGLRDTSGDIAPANLSSDLTHIAKRENHFGKNIWAMSSIEGKDGTTTVATGGADGRIVTFHIPGQDSRHKGRFQSIEEWTTSRIFQTIRDLNLPPERGAIDAFKAYFFVTRDRLVAVTAQGVVLLGMYRFTSAFGSFEDGFLTSNTAEDISWRFLGEAPSLKNYSVIAGEPSEELAFLAGADGIVYIYRSGWDQIRVLCQVDRKISGIFPKSDSKGNIDLLITCVGQQSAIYCRFSMVDYALLNSSIETVTFELPPTFIVTAMTVFEHNSALPYMVVGSRTGSLATYVLEGDQDDRKILRFCDCYRKVQGEDAITQIVELPYTQDKSEARDSLRNKIYFLTTGRCGIFSIFEICIRNDAAHAANPPLTMVHASSPPFGPLIEGAFFDPRTRNLILYGFRSKDFVIWNESKQQQLMSVDCGGAHRSWALYPSIDLVGGCRFVWTKAARLNIYSQLTASHRVLQYGGHGREIKAISVAPSPSEIHFHSPSIIATGAEDTTIRLFEYNTRNRQIGSRELRCLGIFKRHATGIQHLQWSPHGDLLFSSGGNEEFLVWRVTRIPGYGLGMRLEGTCPLEGDVSDLRITNFDILPLHVTGSKESDELDEFVVSMVFSDSTVKVYTYTSGVVKPFKLLLRGRYTTCCLTQAAYQISSDRCHLVTAATDGHIALWNLTQPLKEQGIVVESGRLVRYAGQCTEGSILPERRVAVHQSTIKCMNLISLAADSFMVAAGGDDNALSITLVSLHAPGDPSFSKVIVPFAHASGINALVTIQSDSSAERQMVQLASSSNDQRIKLWSVGTKLDKWDSEGRARLDTIEVHRRATVYTSVADVSSMDVVSGAQKDPRLIVGGVGMDIWAISSMDCV